MKKSTIVPRIMKTKYCFLTICNKRGGVRLYFMWFLGGVIEFKFCKEVGHPKFE